jgi:glycosyltransferase involved in cell wall biosynthesis
MIKRVVFWQNIPSPHTAPYIRALAALGHYDVSLVVQEAYLAWRRDMGWTDPDLSGCELIISPDRSTISEILREQNDDCVHIFSAIHAYPMVWYALKRSLSTRHKIAILSEPGDWRGVKGFGRLLRSRFDAKRFGERIDFILAIGETGVEWFLKSGYPASKVFPFGYFTESPSTPILSGEHNNASDSCFRMIFLGQCVERKGLDLLLEALGGLTLMSWHLDVVGDGPEKQNLQGIASTLKLSDRVTFWGTQKNDIATRILENSDLLVLPSRWDGWGAVVNEALLRGIPVVCSNLCGAADLLREPILGSVVPRDSITELRQVLAQRIAQGPLSSDTSDKIKRWSVNIRGEAAADYVAQILESSSTGGAKPTPPWYSKV